MYFSYRIIKASIYFNYFYDSTMHLLKNRTTNDTFFSIAQYYDQIRFRDTIQTKAYPFDSLVGNMGGYMGLFLGYSLVQVPNFIEVVAGVVMRQKAGKQIASQDRVKVMTQF